MGYNISFRYCSCWSCGSHPLWEVIHLLTGLPAKKCFELIGEIPKNDGPRIRKTGKLTYPEGRCPLTKHHKDYIRSRNLDPDEIIQKWGIQAIGVEGGKLSWRLFIPVHLYGETVSWTTRSINDSQPRYFAASDEKSDISVKSLLYGMDHVRNSVVVVEGPVDVWAIGYGAVAVMGLYTTPAQLEALSKVPIRMVCFDLEPNAQYRARRLCNDLAVFGGTTHLLHLESGKDPAVADKREIAQLRRLLL